MRFFENLRAKLNEALPLSTALDYSRGWNKERYDKMFDGKYRIVLSVPKNLEVVPDEIDLDYTGSSPTFTALKKKLSRYSIYFDSTEDYLKGIVWGNTKFEDALQEVPEKTREKILQLYKSDPLPQAYDPKNKIIVISRHPYDLAGMSTNRSWTSCMRIPIPGHKGGSYCKHVKEDIKEGTLIAYYTDKEDTNLQHPFGRVLIKPFKTLDPKLAPRLVVSNNIYGTMPQEVRLLIKDWIDKQQAKTFFSKISKKKTITSYQLPPNLYPDYGDDTTLIVGDMKRLTQIVKNDSINVFKELMSTGSISLYSLIPESYDSYADEFYGELFSIFEFALLNASFKIAQYLTTVRGFDSFIKKHPPKIDIVGIILSTGFNDKNLSVIEALVKNKVESVIKDPSLLGEIVKDFLESGTRSSKKTAYVLSIIKLLLQNGASLKSDYRKDLMGVDKTGIYIRYSSYYIYDLLVKPEVKTFYIHEEGIREEDYDYIVALFKQHGAQSQPSRVKRW